jgi:hypothetical protein
MYAEGQRDAAISAMRQAADLDDASEKTVAMENKLLPIRTLLGELYLAAGLDKEALVEFEASDRIVPNHFRSIDGGCGSTRVGFVRYGKALLPAIDPLGGRWWQQPAGNH